MKKTIFILLLFVSGYGLGQQLVYEPVNPAFGGNTFNYQWLLSSAEAQNGFEDPNSILNREELTELERFQQDLNRQILGSLSRTVFNSQLGEGLQEGTFAIGDLALEIYETPEGLVINILDTSTGEQTQIVVPN